MIRRALLPAALVLALAFAAACDDDGGTTSTSRTVPSGSPAPTVGIGELDQLISAAYAADEIELAGLTGYTEVACTSDSARASAGEAPACRENEQDGELVQVLPSSDCENRWVRPEQAPDVYAASLPDSGVTLHAIYTPRVDEATFGGGFGTTHVLVFDSGDDDDDARGAALWVDGGRIVWVRTPCSGFDELTAPENVNSFVIEPEGGTSTAPSPDPAETAPVTATPAPPPAP
jgi:hypothetical protein